MANFSFLKDKKDYSDFASDCIEAENAYKNSPNACVRLVRAALEASVKWLYRKDKKFVKAAHQKSGESGSLLAMTSTPIFTAAVGQTLSRKIHYCRQVGNKAIHDEENFSANVAETCLSNLFDFVQWIDKNYGKNYKPRSFDVDDIPAEDSTVKKVLTGAVAVGAGVVLKTLWDKFIDDKS